MGSLKETISEIMFWIGVIILVLTTLNLFDYTLIALVLIIGILILSCLSFYKEKLLNIRVNRKKKI